MKLNYKNTILVGLAFFSINAFWQLYEAVIPLILSQTFELKETLTGIIMAFDNILALFLLPLFGVLSDRSSTRLGKRTPFIIIGTSMAVILMLFIPIADNTANFNLFIISLGGVLIAMCIYRSPAVALMPDITPKPLRSQANAVINLMGTLGTLSTLLLISVLITKDGSPDYSVLFMSVAAIMIFSVIIMVMTIHENTLANEINRINMSILNLPEDYNDTEPSEVVKAEKLRNIKSDLMMLSEDVRKSLIYILCSVFFWFMAFNAVSTAFSRYAVNVMGFKGGSYAGVLLVAMVFATVGYIPMGYVSSRLGRKRTIITGIICMTSAYAVAVFFTHFSWVIYIIFAITGFGWSAINVNAYPMVVEMSSGKDIGKYTGLYYTFSTAAQIVTPVLSGFFLENISYRALFPYATFFSVLSLLTMIKVKHGDSVPPETLKKWL